MSRAPLTDYEKYIRTEELLSLQKGGDKLSCHDELVFQVVHQVAELWMKLIDHELTGAGVRMKAGEVASATRSLERVRRIQVLLNEQLGVLDTLPSKEYMTIRSALGRGSGQESPGFKRLLRLPDEIWPSFVALLESQAVALRQVYENPDAHPDLYTLAEAMTELDQNLQLWRQRHLMLVYRQIGAGTPSLKGKPSELLAEGLKHRFFPKLWEVRDELFAQWSKANPTGAQSGYHG